jgi:glycosyltransferase involved in cell wall biosynthesis
VEQENAHWAAILPTWRGLSIVLAMATGARTSRDVPSAVDGRTRPLRVAIVPPTPVPYREPLFAALHQRPELEVCVIYQSSAQPSWDVAQDWFSRRHPYPAEHLRSWQRSRPGRSPVVWPRGLSRALSAADPDCVVAFEYGPASLRAMWWCRRRGRAYAVLTECTPQIDAMLSPAQLRLHRWVARRADALIPVSSAAAGRLAAFGVPAERITIALQAADLDAVRAAAGARDEQPGPLAVLSVGRLVPDKNFAGLIEAIARVPGGVVLDIAGTGFLEPELRGHAERLGVSVRFHGHVPPADLPGLYATADVYALVSTYEPFGVSVREAAAAGLPIVCSRVAGAAGDVAVADRNAILVDPGSVAQITDALARLAAEPDLRRRMADQSRLVDAETEGREVDAFAGAVVSATQPR